MFFFKTKKQLQTITTRIVYKKGFLKNFINQRVKNLSVFLSNNNNLQTITTRIVYKKGFIIKLYKSKS